MTAGSLTVEVELLDGTYEAQRARSRAQPVEPETAGEWPPSPARLTAALVATAYRCGKPGMLEQIAELCKLDPPIVFASRAVFGAQPRRYPTRTLKREVTSSFLKTVAKNPRSPEGWAPDRETQSESFRAIPEHPTVRFVWEGPLETKTRESLDFLCSRIGYLGRPSGQVAVRIVEGEPEPVDGTLRWEPFPYSGTTRVASDLAVPYPGFLEAMEASRKSGIPFPVQAAYREIRRYRASGSDGTVQSPWRTHEWIVRGGRLNPRHTVRFADTIRSQALSISGKLDPQVSGHGADGMPHVGWWPVVNDKTQRLIVAVPDGLVCPNIPEQVNFDGMNLTLTPTPFGLVWETRPSRVWASLTPLPKTWSSEARLYRTVKRQLDQAGLPTLAAIEVSKSPIAPGSLPATAYRLGRKGNEDRTPPGVHTLMVFDQPIEGLFAVGDLRHFGSGLMVPLEEVSL